MNAAPPVFHAPPPSDVAQPDTPAPAVAAGARAGSQDFAAALSDAGGKPARKIAANKQQGPAPSGSSLPGPGNPPPPALNSPPAAKTDVPAAAAAIADAAAIVKSVQGRAQGATPTTLIASAAPGNAGSATDLSNSDPTAPAVPGAAPGLATSPAPSGVDATAAASSATTAIGSGMSMPHALSMRTLAIAGASKAGAAAPAPAGNTRGANSNNTPANAADNSAPASNDANAPSDSTLSNGPAAAGADAASQVAMAAAVVQGTGAPLPDTTSSDQSAMTETGAPQGAAAGSSDPAAGSPAAAFARASAASMSAAATAATAATAAAAAAATQVLADAAGAADKRSHANSPDATLAGASNDGSVGASQLLTSNTSTDTAPTPTFKVAAGVDTAQFGQGVVDRVSLMMDGNLTSAKLQVNPPSLGPIEVRIALQGGHAQVWLSSHSAVTRDALESSSPKLREMLGSQGFSQVSVDISQRSFQERSPPSQAYESSPIIGGDAALLAQAPRSMPRSASGLLDAYA